MEEDEASSIPATGDPERFAEAHRRVLGDSSLQFELEPMVTREPPAWLRWLFDLLGKGGPVIEALFWGAIVLFGLTLLYLLFRWLQRNGFLGGTSGDGDPEDEAAAWRPEEAPARALLGEADRLAAEGRFAEAAHLLLQRSIEDIDARRPQLVRPALTSRDIAGAPALPPRPKAAFSRIVMLVERSLFGGRPLGAGDWRDCRAAYEEFAFAGDWRG